MVPDLVSEEYPENITISYGEYASLVADQQSAAYVFGIIAEIASEPDASQLVTAQEFARNLLDEWSK